MGILIDIVNILMDLELIIENLSTSWLSLPVLSRNVTDIEETDFFEQMVYFYLHPLLGVDEITGESWQVVTLFIVNCI
jgi:hypothetical protein